MSDKSIDVLAVGNAIVDVIADADDGFLERHGMAKGAMRSLANFLTLSRSAAISSPRSASNNAARSMFSSSIWAAGTKLLQRTRPAKR